ncbi:CHASE domain-containing protein [Sulfitobacter sp. HNIBRBA2951]|uniref:CHASE domain-containing protein n=1 Tax=Sulfitobacter aquimarinus TaxID=3158557 RepID=UPI0032DF1671
MAIALSIFLTIAAWQFSKHLIDLRTQSRFEVAADHIPELMRERLQKYELALLAGVSALRANGGAFSWDEWRVFASSLDIEHLYPGINGIGRIHIVPPEDLESYLAKQRIDRPYFRVHPEHGKNMFEPITYIYPVEANAQAVGLDMVHEKNRHLSLNKAGDTGTPQITGPIVLVQDAARTPGFLFFAPTYQQPEPVSQSERQARFTGAVYAPFIVSKLIEGTLGQERRRTLIRISDDTEVIYDELNSDSADFDADPLGAKRVSMDVYGRTWDIDIRSGLEFRALNFPKNPTYILAGAIAIDIAVLTMFLLLARANRRGLRFADMATQALRRDAVVLKQMNVDLEAARKQAETVGAMKSAFLSTMSHEVRTPLTAISGILMLLDRAKLPAAQDHLIQAGKAASERLLKLLTNVLELTKLEANAVTLWERTVEIKPLMEQWHTMAKGIIETHSKPLAIEVIVSEDLPDTVVVDDIRLSQIINNLVDNAVRFTGEGRITISASCGAEGMYVLSVADTGVGLAQADLVSVFDRFRQVDDSFTRAEGGTGLGLAICRDLTQLLGGQIEAFSVLGAGATFAVTLPLAGAQASGTN